MDAADLRLLITLYFDEKALVRIGNGRSGWTEIWRGEGQSWVWSPDLLSLYSHAVIDVLENMEGISTGGNNINIMMDADDMGLIADTVENL